MSSSTSSSSNSVARTVHDLGLAAWFGGSLMGAVGVNAGAAGATKNSTSTKVAGAGWSSWTPVNLAAIGAYLGGGAVLTVANRKRMAAQRGVGSASAVKVGLTVVALGATAYARYLGQKVIDAPGERAEDGTTPTEATDDEVAKAQRQLAVLQWVIPASTAGIIATSAVLGEQQRPSRVIDGVAQRVSGALHLDDVSGQLGGVAERVSSVPAAVADRVSDVVQRGDLSDLSDRVSDVVKRAELPDRVTDVLHRAS